jgi:Skp family chaperone for outer membrane proteins
VRTCSSLAVAASAALCFGHLLLLAPAARAQDFFIPGQQKAQPAPKATPQTHAQQRPAQGMGEMGGMAPPEPEQPPPPPSNADLPPPPELPPIAKGEAPPAAVIGVLGVPDVMHASTAAQEVEKIIGARRSKLNDDAQKEQAAWRDMQQSLANDRTKLSADQIRARERDLQERITNAQRTFRERNRIIQEAAQYALAQIERTLVSVIRQVAESRGMNLVLHRSQVALNVNQFDITDAVAAQLNKVLPSVIVPPDGVSPSAMAAAAKKEGMKPIATAPAPAPATTPAPAAPAAPAPAPAAPAAAPAQ